MRQKLFLLLVVTLVFAVGTTVGAEEGDWLKTDTSFDPLFKDVYLACQGVSTARGTLSEVYGRSREIANLHGIKKEAEKEILEELGNRKSELTKEQLSYFKDALISLGTATRQAKESLKACQSLQPRLQEAIEKAPEELAFQPWKIKKVVKGLKDSLVQVTNASKEGAILVKELAEITPLVQKIVGQKQLQ